jgi:hypothetical protein
MNFQQNIHCPFFEMFPFDEFFYHKIIGIVDYALVSKDLYHDGLSRSNINIVSILA